MDIREDITNAHDTLCKWRHELHENPQTAFEETYAATFIKAKLDDGHSL